MKTPAILAMLCAILGGVSMAGQVLSAQHAPIGESDLLALLQGKTLFLHDEWIDNKLSFDAAGHLLGHATQDSFTSSALHIQEIKRKGNTLELTARRFGIEFPKGVPQEVALRDNSKVTLRIDVPSDGNYAPAMANMFVDGLAALAPLLPPYWHDYALAHFHLLPGQTAPQAKQEPSPGVYTPGGDVKLPKLLLHPDPAFTQTARNQHFTGATKLSFEVDTMGAPQHIGIVRAAGLGLDEQAVRALRQYTFTPGSLHGKPVPVAMSAEINFSVF